MKYMIQIVEYETDRVEKVLTGLSKREADKIEDGININLNHEKYFTRIVQEQVK